LFESKFCPGCNRDRPVELFDRKGFSNNGTKPRYRTLCFQCDPRHARTDRYRSKGLTETVAIAYCVGCGKVIRSCDGKRCDPCKEEWRVSYGHGRYYKLLAGQVHTVVCQGCGTPFECKRSVSHGRTKCDGCLKKTKAIGRYNRNARRRARLSGGDRIIPLEVFERDNWICGICSLPIDREAKCPDPFSPSVDHIIPLANGGKHTWDNVQASHFTCNAVKSNTGAIAA